jgi:SSS family solute:Na+ symporter
VFTLSVTGLDLTVIALYMLALLAIGLLSERIAIRTLDNYLLANRQLSYLLYVPAMAAVVLGGASTLGSARLGYQYGVSGAWLVIMISLGVIACGLIVARKIIPLRIYTMAEFLERRYSRPTRYLAAIVIAIYTFMIYVTQVIAIGTVTSVVLGISFELGVLIGGLVVVAYVALGGMWSVTLTDLLQWALMTLGVIILLPVAGYLAVSAKGVSLAELPQGYFSPTHIGYDTILSYFLLFFFGLMLGQDIWQRVLTAKDTRIGINGTVLAGLYGIVYALAATFAGMLAYLYFGGALENPRQAMPLFAAEILPAGIAGLMIAAMFSAFMSTADGALIATTTLITYDLVAPLRRLTERQMVLLVAGLNVILGILGLGVAIFVQELLIALDIAYLVLSTTLFIPTVLGLYWAKPSARAAIIAIAGSLIVAVGYALYIGWPDGFADIRPIVAGFATNLVIFLIATYLWPSKTT